MGILSGIGNFLDKAGDVVGGVLPGPIGAAVDMGSDFIGNISGSGGSSRSRNLPARRTPGINSLPSMPSQPASKAQATGMMFNRLQQETPQQFDPTLQAAANATGAGNGGAVQGFQQALMMEMLSDSVRSKDGKAILEAMLHGSLSGGMIQQTHPVQTPRGVRHYSQPGFRTVEVNGQKISVFKPLARALKLLPKRSKAKLTNADFKTIRKADRLTKKVKKLAKNTGRLKVTNK